MEGTLGSERHGGSALCVEGVLVWKGEAGMPVELDRMTGGVSGPGVLLTGGG
jgi:hypothetical protein